MCVCWHLEGLNRGPQVFLSSCGYPFFDFGTGHGLKIGHVFGIRVLVAGLSQAAEAGNCGPRLTQIMLYSGPGGCSSAFKNITGLREEAKHRQCGGDSGV